MPLTRIDVDEAYDADGVLISSTERTVDITAPMVELGIHVKLRAALLKNRDYLKISAPTETQQAAQVERLTRQLNHLIRLRLVDLLSDETVD